MGQRVGVDTTPMRLDGLEVAEELQHLLEAVVMLEVVVSGAVKVKQEIRA